MIQHRSASPSVATFWPAMPRPAPGELSALRFFLRVYSGGLIVFLAILS